MSDSINDINNDIDAKIFVNPNGEITEPILNALLKRMATFTNDRLPVDGSAPMTGELNTDGKGIKLSDVAGKINKVSIVGDDVVFTGEGFIIISNLKGLKVDKDIEASGEIRSIDSAVVLQKTGLGKVSISTVGLTGDRQALFPNKDITVAGLDDITAAIAAHNPTLAQILTNGNDAAGQIIQLNGANSTLKATLGAFSTLDTWLETNGILKLGSGRNFIDFKGSAETLRHDISALDGLGGSSPIVVTWQNKPITVAGLDDITTAINNLINAAPGALDTLNELAAALGNDPNFATTVNNAIAARLKLDGTTPMTGDLDMTTNNVAVQTNKIKTAAGILELLLGTDILKLDFSAISGGSGSYLQTFRAKAGTVAHLDDIKNFNFIEHTEASHTGNTTETVLHTIEIPPNTIGVGDCLNSYIQAIAVGLNGVKTWRVYISPNPSLTGAELIYNFSTNNLRYMISRKMWVGVGSVIKQFRLPAQNISHGLYGSDDSGVADTAIIDFTTTKYLVVSVQLDNAADVATLRMSNLLVSKPNN